jgi:hypothetical protein
VVFLITYLSNKILKTEQPDEKFLAVFLIRPHKQLFNPADMPTNLEIACKHLTHGVVCTKTVGLLARQHEGARITVQAHSRPRG